MNAQQKMRNEQFVKQTKERHNCLYGTEEVKEIEEEKGEK